MDGKSFSLTPEFGPSRPARRWMDGGHVLVWVTPYRFGGSTWPVFCHLLLAGHHHEGVYFKREKFIRSIELLQRSSPGDDEWHTRSDLCAGARRWGRMLVCDFVKLWWFQFLGPNEEAGLHLILRQVYFEGFRTSAGGVTCWDSRDTWPRRKVWGEAMYQNSMVWSTVWKTSINHVSFGWGESLGSILRRNKPFEWLLLSNMESLWRLQMVKDDKPWIK